MNGECPECLVDVLRCKCMCRKEIPINWKRADELLEAGCLGTEVAAYFGMHPETFYDRVVKEKKVGFSEYSSKKKSSGEALIREAQFDKAVKKKDNSMLIWLGKQRLGQKDSPSEHIVNEEIMKHYLDVMKQIASFQEERKMADSSKSKEKKSA